METKLYVLEIATDISYGIDIAVIGIYSTKEKAEAAREKYKEKMKNIQCPLDQNIEYDEGIDERHPNIHFYNQYIGDYTFSIYETVLDKNDLEPVTGAYYCE